MKKQIGKRVLTVTLTFVLAAVALFSFTGCTKKLYTEGDFVYYVPVNALRCNAVIVGLSEEGKTKEFVVVPEEINNRKVTSLKAKGIDQSKYWKSENLKKVFIPLDGNGKIGEHLFDGCPNLEKLILYRSHDTKTKISNKNNPNLKVYVSGKNYDEEVYNGSNLYKTSGEGYADIYFANVAFMGSDQKIGSNKKDDVGYYFINDCEYNGKIDYRPPLPFVLGMWSMKYCYWVILKGDDAFRWDFENSILDMFENGKYQELKLHASAVDFDIY